jgi:hypothetical protein
VLGTIAEMLEGGATHIGVATDHVVESFRNDLWPEYKTSEGIEPVLHAQFFPLEEALAAMGVVVWPMIELEADDALASAAQLAARDERVEKVCIWTPDKDLNVLWRVVQMDRGRPVAMQRSPYQVRCCGIIGLPRLRVTPQMYLIGTGSKTAARSTCAR